MLTLRAWKRNLIMSHERLILNSILNMKCMYLCTNVWVFSIFSPLSYSHSMFFRVPRHIILRLSYHNATCYSPRVFSFINIMFSEIWARFSWLFIAENNRKKKFFCFFCCCSLLQCCAALYLNCTIYIYRRQT